MIIVFNILMILGFIILYVLSILWYFDVVYPYAVYTKTHPLCICLSVLISPICWLLTHSLYGDDNHYKQVLKTSYELQQAIRNYRKYTKKSALFRLKITYANVFLIADSTKVHPTKQKTKLEVAERLKNKDGYFLLDSKNTYKFFKTYCSGYNIFGDETELDLFTFELNNSKQFKIYNITNYEQIFCDQQNIKLSNYEDLIQYISK